MKTVLEILLISAVGLAGKIVPVPRNIQDAPPEDISTNIVNGLDAFPGQFPYMASIQWATGEPWCSGALIDPLWVVTVAHCVHNDPSQYRVVLGLHDFDDFENGGSPQVYNLQEIRRHPDHEGYKHNIALLRLSSPVNPYNPYIQTIALPPDNEDDFSEYSCYMCGWGAKYPNGPSGGVLQYHTTDYIANEDCKAMTGEDKVLCFTSDRSAACQGDWGIPAVCRRDGLTYLAGVLSGIYCLVDWPSFYSPISEHNDWIRSIIG